MFERLIKLYNTLMLITTKGEDTKTMANCLAFLEKLIAEEQENQKAPHCEQESSK